MKYYRIHLLRHGETTANLEGRFVGSTDVELCEEGKEELRKLRDTYEYPGIQKVFSSPLKRCLQTAEILYPGFEPEVVDDLREYDFGKYENLMADDIINDPDFMEWIRTGKAADTMENTEEFHERLRLGLETVLKRMMAEKLTSAAVVTHGGVLMTLLSSFGLPKREPKMWLTGNGHGFTVATSAQLWQSGNFVEVFDPLPYDSDEESVSEYSVVDVETDEDDQEDED